MFETFNITKFLLKLISLLVGAYLNCDCSDTCEMTVTPFKERKPSVTSPLTGENESHFAYYDYTFYQNEYCHSHSTPEA